MYPEPPFDPPLPGLNPLPPFGLVIDSSGTKSGIPGCCPGLKPLPPEPPLPGLNPLPPFGLFTDSISHLLDLTNHTLKFNQICN